MHYDINFLWRARQTNNYTMVDRQSDKQKNIQWQTDRQTDTQHAKKEQWSIKSSTDY